MTGSKVSPGKLEEEEDDIGQIDPIDEGLKLVLNWMHTPGMTPWMLDRFRLASASKALREHYMQYFDFLDDTGVQESFEASQTEIVQESDTDTDVAVSESKEEVVEKTVARKPKIRTLREYMELCQQMPNWAVPDPKILNIPFGNSLELPSGETQEFPYGIPRVLSMYLARERIMHEYEYLIARLVMVDPGSSMRAVLKQHVISESSNFEHIISANALLANYNHDLAEIFFKKPSICAELGCQHVNASARGLTRLPGIVIQRHIEKLNARKLFVHLDVNLLQALPPEIFQIGTLVELSCDNNILTDLPWDALARKLSSSRFSFTAEGNRLTRIPRGIPRFPVGNLFYQFPSFERFGRYIEVEAELKAAQARFGEDTEEFEQAAIAAASPEKPILKFDGAKPIMRRFLKRKLKELFESVVAPDTTTTSESSLAKTRPQRTVLILGPGAGAGARLNVRDVQQHDAVEELNDDKAGPSPQKRARNG